MPETAQFKDYFSEKQYVSLLTEMLQAIRYRVSGPTYDKESWDELSTLTERMLAKNRISADLLDYDIDLEPDFISHGKLAFLNVGATCRGRVESVEKPYRAPFIVYEPVDRNGKSSFSVCSNCLDALSESIYQFFLYKEVLYLNVLDVESEARRDVIKIYSLKDSASEVCRLESKW